MKKLVMVLAVLSLLLIASCIGPGRATGPQATKVQIATSPRAPGVVVDMCDDAYPTMCSQTTTSGGIATFSNVPLGSRKITATSERGTVTKYAIIKYVQPPRSFIVVMDVTDILPDLDGDGVANVIDNCPMTSNADQADADRDKRGDVCDNCVNVANYNQADSDSNGVGNVCQVCVQEDIASGQAFGNSWSKSFTARVVDKLKIVEPNIAHHHNWCSNSIGATISLNGVAADSQSTSGCPAVLASILDFEDKMADKIDVSWYIGSQSWGIGNLVIVSNPCFAIGVVKPQITCLPLVGIVTANSVLSSAPPGSLVTIADNQVCYCLDANDDDVCDG